MISIRIGEEERQVDLDSLDSQWINQQIVNRQNQGENSCVIIRIQKDGINLMLATPDCSLGGSGNAPPPNPQEQAIIDLWRERGLSNTDFSSGNVVAFLKQLKQLC